MPEIKVCGFPRHRPLRTHTQVGVYTPNTPHTHTSKRAPGLWRLLCGISVNLYASQPWRLPATLMCCVWKSVCVCVHFCVCLGRSVTVCVATVQVFESWQVYKALTPVLILLGRADKSHTYRLSPSAHTALACTPLPPDQN